MRGLCITARTTRTSIGTPPAGAEALGIRMPVARDRVSLAAPAPSEDESARGHRTRHANAFA